MFYHEYPPPPALKPYIRCLWMLEHDYRQSFHTYEHLWADTHTELIFSFGERYYRRSDGRKGRKIRLPENFIIGPLSKELLLYSDGFTGFIAARFHPWGFCGFSTQKATVLVNAILPAAKALPPGIRQLEQQLLRHPSREEKLRLLTDHLIDMKPPPNPDSATLQAIVTELQTLHGKQKITHLAEQFNINPRKLERHFLQGIGLPAKLFARILRFNHAKDLIQKDPDIPLAALAYETGYADQAHFSRNFRQLFNYTPAQFKARIKKFKAETSGLDRDVVFVQD
jgi:AraC-like DNA-binding protein